MADECINLAVMAADRAEAQKPQCTFGQQGICCRICNMGPCRITNKGKAGVCGATGALMAARHFARMIAAGSSAHSDHGRAVAETLIAVAEGKAPGYRIKDEVKLMVVANLFGINTEGKSISAVAKEVGEKALAEFGKQHGSLLFISRAPEKRQELWMTHNMIPRGIDREIVETLHRTSMGVDQEIVNLMLHGSRAALADGWGGSMIATELQDILFGTPIPLRAKVNLGVLKEDEVNIVIHGHEPLLSEMIVYVSGLPEMVKMAKAKGAKGINLAGICCTANEVLMRHGVGIAGTFAQQELAITTGAVDAMVVDVQCVMVGLAELTKCYHTKLISTSPRAKLPGATHIEFHEMDAVNSAKEIVKAAIENYQNRKEVNIPKETMELVAGFSYETINYMLGGKFRGSCRPLNDNIMNGKIQGVVGVVGCEIPRKERTKVHTDLVKQLIANDILVVQTGCAAICSAQEGLMIPEAAEKYAGPGLREVCETVGIPPVLHSGSCVDNSRILIATSEMVREGGLGNDISDLPVAGACPDWMNEKAIAIGQYVVASGIYTVFGGRNFPVGGAPEFSKLLYEGFENITKATWAYEPDANKMADLIINHIKKKREALGIHTAKERVLYDMEMRRTLEV